jgi:hypothetical protein
MPWERPKGDEQESVSEVVSKYLKDVVDGEDEFDRLFPRALNTAEEVSAEAEAKVDLAWPRDYKDKADKFHGNHVRHLSEDILFPVDKVLTPFKTTFTDYTKFPGDPEVSVP